MTRCTAIVCTFTEGLDELPQKKQRNPCDVARHIARAGRSSIFEATENEVIAATMDWLIEHGWLELDSSCGYPWTKAKLSAVGAAALGRAHGEVRP